MIDTIAETELRAELLRRCELDQHARFACIDAQARGDDVGLPPLDQATIASAWTPEELRQLGYPFAENTTSRAGSPDGVRELDAVGVVSARDPHTVEFMDFVARGFTDAVATPLHAGQSAG